MIKVKNVEKLKYNQFIRYSLCTLVFVYNEGNLKLQILLKEQIQCVFFFLGFIPYSRRELVSRGNIDAPMG